VVDNNNANNDLTQARFSASTNWSTTANNAQKYQNDFRLASGAGPANDGAELYFYIRTPGTYSVEAWWPAVSTRSAAASYRVFELDGGAMLADLTRDQRIDGGKWDLLGTFSFTMVGWAKVLMSRSLSGPGSLAADAIRVTLVSAENRAPVARISAPAPAAEGSPVAFDGSGSFDFDGDPLAYSWSFGDGGTETGPLATHAYPDNSTFTVTLTSTDPDGRTGSASRFITVANVSPTVDAGPDTTITSGDTFTLSGTFSDPGVIDAPWSWTVDWAGATAAGDASDPFAPIAPSRQLCTAGTHTVGLSVVDKDGGAGNDSLQLTVERYPIGMQVKPQTLKLNGSGQHVVVHVLSTAAFDAAQLQMATVRLTNLAGSGTPVAILNNGDWFLRWMDVDGDGLTDLILHFNRDELVQNGDLTAATTALHLLADVTDCRQVLGSSSVSVIP
jgi:hypothetical protein